MCCSICEYSFSTSCGVLHSPVSSSSIFGVNVMFLLLAALPHYLKGQIHSSIYRLTDWWKKQLKVSGKKPRWNLSTNRRSEERREGKECVSTCRYRCWPLY